MICGLQVYAGVNWQSSSKCPVGGPSLSQPTSASFWMADDITGYATSASGCVSNSVFSRAARFSSP